MPFRLNQLGVFVLTIYFVLSSFLCYGQGGVSKNSPNDTTEHILNLDTNKLLHFNVSASDGKMSRIDAVSDSGSSWVGSGIDTSTANFTGTPNAGKSGTFRPGFSGQVKLTGSGSGQPQTYEWTAKAKYELPGKFQVEIEPEDNFNGNRSTLGIGEPAKVVVSSREGENNIVAFERMEITGKNSNNTDTLVNIALSTFEAGHYSGSATIKVWAYVNGFSSGPETVTVSVIEPSGARIVQEPGTGIWHVQNTGSVGFLGRPYILPDNVSFWKVTVREGTCNAYANGYWVSLNNIQHPAGQTWVQISKGLDPLTQKPNKRSRYN